MVLKRSFIGDIGDGSAVYIHCSSILGDRALSWYDSFSPEMVLKCPFIDDCGKILLCMLTVQVFLETELFKFIQKFYSEDGLEKPIHQWHWGRLCSVHSLFRSSRRKSFLVDTVVLLRRCSLNDLSLMTLIKRLGMFIVQVFWETELLELIELFLRDHEMAGCLVETLWRQTKWVLLSSGTELFKLEQLYLEDGLEMEGHSAITLREDSAPSILTHIMVLKYMSLCAPWQTTSTAGGTLMTRLENGLERK